MNEQSISSYHELQHNIKLRFVRCASFALAEDRLEEFQHQFEAQIIQGYGMTETASVITLNPFDSPKPGSAGKPIGTEVAILVDGQIQGADTDIGEIIVKGDHVIEDYLESKRTAFHGEWLLTGDIGYLDAEGYLFIKGRSREMINHGGEKIAPVTVENTLSKLKFIDDIAVIGLPDELYGETVTAVVQSRTGDVNEFKETKAIIDYAKKHLAKFEQPTQVFYVDEFPRNPTGKIIRSELKQRLSMMV